VKVSETLLRELIRNIIDEEIRKVKGGYKVYPKKPKPGEKRRKAFSKKPMSREKALRQLRAIERSKSMKEDREKLQMYKKYDLGIDVVKDKTKGHEEIIGHT
tara:strand:+ start:212 stop:517 length:306 start_codon:yes stop_codon:yes gene_type:complete